MTADIHALAGAYALDALDAEERAVFEQHLAACQACRQEVETFRATAVRLGAAAYEQPPTGLRRRVLEEIDRTRQVSPPVRPRAPARGWSPRLRRLAVPAAAVLALVVLGLGALVGQLNQRVERLEEASGELASVLAAHDASLVEMQAPSGVVARFAYSPSLGKGVLVAEGLEPMEPGRTYQLWLIGDEGPVSAGLFRPTGRLTTAVAEGDVQPARAVGVTVEPAGGSPQPTGDILLLGELEGAGSV